MGLIDPQQNQCKTLFDRATVTSLSGNKVTVSYQAVEYALDYVYHCPGGDEATSPGQGYRIGDIVVIEMNESKVPQRVIGHADGAQECDVYGVAIIAGSWYLYVNFSGTYCHVTHDEANGDPLDPIHYYRDVRKDFEQETAGLDGFNASDAYIECVQFAENWPFRIGIVVMGMPAYDMLDKTYTHIFLDYSIDESTRAITLNDSQLMNLDGNHAYPDLSRRNSQGECDNPHNSGVEVAITKECGQTLDCNVTRIGQSQEWIHDALEWIYTDWTLSESISHGPINEYTLNETMGSTSFVSAGMYLPKIGNPKITIADRFELDYYQLANFHLRRTTDMVASGGYGGGTDTYTYDITNQSWNFDDEAWAETERFEDIYASCCGGYVCRDKGYGCEPPHSTSYENPANRLFKYAGWQLVGIHPVAAMWQVEPYKTICPQTFNGLLYSTDYADQIQDHCSTKMKVTTHDGLSYCSSDSGINTEHDEFCCSAASCADDGGAAIQKYSWTYYDDFKALMTMGLSKVFYWKDIKKYDAYNCPDEGHVDIDVKYEVLGGSYVPPGEPDEHGPLLQLTGTNSFCVGSNLGSAGAYGRFYDVWSTSDKLGNNRQVTDNIPTMTNGEQVGALVDDFGRGFLVSSSRVRAYKELEVAGTITPAGGEDEEPMFTAIGIDWQRPLRNSFIIYTPT